MIVTTIVKTVIFSVFVCYFISICRIQSVFSNAETFLFVLFLIKSITNIIFLSKLSPQPDFAEQFLEEKKKKKKYYLSLMIVSCEFRLTWCFRRPSSPRTGGRYSL